MTVTFLLLVQKEISRRTKLAVLKGSNSLKGLRIELHRHCALGIGYPADPVDSPVWSVTVRNAQWRWSFYYMSQWRFPAFVHCCHMRPANSLCLARGCLRWRAPERPDCLLAVALPVELMTPMNRGNPNPTMILILPPIPPGKDKTQAPCLVPDRLSASRPSPRLKKLYSSSQKLLCGLAAYK